MTSPIGAALRQMMIDQADAILDHWRTGLQAVGGNYLRGLTPLPEQHAEMAALLQGLADTVTADDRFESDPHHPLARALRAASQVRAERGFTPEESLRFLHTCKEALITVLQSRQATVPQEAGKTQEATLRIERLMDRCVLILASAFIATREDTLKRQAESLREVSTPVITLWDSMLLLPLVGVVDSVRAQHISERLLDAISQTEAEVTLIDVTGVPVMDTSVARHILRTVAAAEMLGTRVILTGISPTTAQTMVKLGIDMSGVPTRASLKSGVALAMTMTGHRVVASA
jgi:rsbT co-antagonist protein RsbR